MKYTRLSVAKRLAKQVKIPARLIVLLQAVSMLSMLVSLISPYLYSQLVDEVMTNGKATLLYTIVPTMIGVFAVGVGLSALSTFLSLRYNNKVNLLVKTKVFERLMRRNIADVMNVDVGAEQKVIEQDSGVVSGFFSGQIGGFFTSFLYPAIYLVLMLIINPWLSLAVVVFIPLTILFGRFTGKKYNLVNNELWQIGSKNNNYLFDSIQKWREVKAQNLEQDLTDEYNEKLQPERKTLLSWMLYFAFNGVFYDFKSMFVNNVLMYFIGGLLIIAGQLSVGSLLMFMSYMGSFSGNIDSIIKSITDFSGNKAVYERLFDALEYEETPKDTIMADDLNVEANAVTFAYGEDLPNVLTEVTHTFKSGKKYLIIGKSGEGKSTLIKLMLCMIQPNAGSIKLGGKELSKVEQRSLFNKLTAVMQENQFFNLSIRENLLMIAPNATDERIDFACKSADIYDFIVSLPSGYDTIIGERGIKLSGGQKQRLAIARLILHNPQIAILDEATSSLDAVTETKILSNLNEIFTGKTLIVISHKPALQIDFDEIIRVESNILYCSKGA
jgi:ABC-type bacteriocin/lantibiotic exporter with double-glycine peptidase domain